MNNEQPEYIVACVEDCIEFQKQGIPPNCEGIGYYTFSCECVDIEDFDLDGDTDDQLSKIREEDCCAPELNGSYQEFTKEVCPAYIIKNNK